MRSKIIVGIFAVLLVAFTSVSFAEVRTWTQASTNRKITGEFEKMKDPQTAMIKINGRSTPIPLSMLVEADQAYIKAQTTPAVTAPKTPAKVPAGEVTVIVSGVTLNCKKCEENLLASIHDERHGMKNPDSVQLEVTDRRKGIVKIVGKTGKDAKTAIVVLNKMGFYGTPDQAAFALGPPKNPDLVSTTMSLKGINLTCSACVRDVKRIVKSVDGVKTFNVPSAGRSAASFQVQGDDFKPAEVIAALREKGYGGYYQ